MQSSSAIGLSKIGNLQNVIQITNIDIIQKQHQTTNVHSVILFLKFPKGAFFVFQIVKLVQYPRWEPTRRNLDSCSSCKGSEMARFDSEAFQLFACGGTAAQRCVGSVVLLFYLHYRWLRNHKFAKLFLQNLFWSKSQIRCDVSKRIQSNRRTWRDREWESFHSTASLPVPCKSWCLRMSPYHLSGYLLATLPFQSSKADGLLRPAFSWISYCMQIFLDIPLRTSLGLVPFCSSKIHRKFIAIVFVFFWLDVHVLPSGPVACRLDRYLGMSVMLSWSFVNFASSSLLVNC